MFLSINKKNIRRGGSNEYPQSMFLSRNKKNIRVFLSGNFQILEVKFSIHLYKRVFLMLNTAFCGYLRLYIFIYKN